MIGGSGDCMGIFNWRGRVSKSAFRKQFVEHLQAGGAAFDYSLSPQDELELRLTLAGGATQTTSTISLYRAYEEFSANPSGRDEIFQRWKAMALRSGEGTPIRATDVVPMIKSRSWIEDQVSRGAQPPFEGADDALFVDEYNEELVVVYAEHREGISYNVRGDFLQAGIGPASIRELALRNLRERTPEREFHPVGSAWMLTAGGNFEAALLLDEELWANHRFRNATDILASVPERDCLLASTDTSATGVWSFAVMTAHGYRKEQYPISTHILVRRGSRFELLDPLAVDESHPIPNIETIDVHAVKKSGGSTMAVVIASPLAADARSVFRLHRKLDGHLQYIATPAYREECGTGDTYIEIVIHPESHPEIFGLLEALPDFASKSGAFLTVKRLEEGS